MKLGMICAMEEEIRLILQDMKSEKIVNIAGREFHIGVLYDIETVLVLSRIGKVAASMTTALLIDHFEVDQVIFSGTAGGVDPELHTGDIVIGDQSCQHDFKVPGEKFRIPLLNKCYLDSDPNLTKLAFQAAEEYIGEQMKQDVPVEFLKEFGITAPKAVVGTIASGDEFVCEKSRNQWLYENVENVRCVEMEGAAVAQACYEFDIPFTIIRVISDGANDSSNVDFDRFIEHTAKFFTRGVVKKLYGLLKQ
ncbi:MAG: 5'-methylthioadenosine/adenosylhomocysteine nucleosidase [Massiliimalia sp.]|jgi:adenosylhomocysteine nucleosidase